MLWVNHQYITFTVDNNGPNNAFVRCYSLQSFFHFLGLYENGNTTNMHFNYNLNQNFLQFHLITDEMYDLLPFWAKIENSRLWTIFSCRYNYRRLLRFLWRGKKQNVLSQHIEFDIYVLQTTPQQLSIFTFQFYEQITVQCHEVGYKLLLH